jgi:hypothetical protein
MGAHWGLGPFTIEETTERRCRRFTAWPRAGSEGDGDLAAGDRLGHRAAIRDKAGTTVRDAGRTSDQDGPEPGHLIEEARSERTGGRRERSDG